MLRLQHLKSLGQLIQLRHLHRQVDYTYRLIQHYRPTLPDLLLKNNSYKLDCFRHFLHTLQRLILLMFLYPDIREVHLYRHYILLPLLPMRYCIDLMP
jgi:hypothetical protein